MCSPAEISDFLTSCVDPGTSLLAWNAVNVAGWTPGSPGTPCGNCIFSPRSKDNGAMWVDPDGEFRPNYGGCVQVLDPTHGAACGAAYNEISACETVTCEYCPSLDANDYTACLTAAHATVCSAPLKNVQDACMFDSASGGPLDRCLAASGGTADYAFLVNLICGPLPADGGVPDGG